MISRDRESTGRPKHELPSEREGAVRPSSCVDARSVEGVLFCGGRSRRMGLDKAELEAPGGGTLIERALAALDAVAARVVLASGDAPRYEHLGRACVLDGEPGAGPLAGLAAALRATDATWLCALACDLPRVRPEILEALLAEAAERDLDACLLRTEGGLEPLVAVYRSTCREAVERALAAGQRRLDAFHGDGVRVGTLPAARFDGGDACAENVNTRADWARALGREEPKEAEGEPS